MANPVWDGVQTYAFYTVALGAVDAKHSTTFNVPAGTQTVTFIVPAFATDATAALEGLSPLDKTTWTAVKYHIEAGTYTALSVATNSYQTVPALLTGTGTFRFVNATDQTTTTPIQ